MNEAAPALEAPPERLHSERLRLERWRDRHLDHFLRLASDARVTRYIGRGGPWTPGEAAATFVAALEQWRLSGFGWRALVEPAGGRWLGFAGLNPVGPGTGGLDAGAIEIGWWLTPAAWGRGYASEAGAALRDEAFERLGLERLVARYQPRNAASGRVMERIGMHAAFDTRGRFGELLRVYRLDRPAWLRLRERERAFATRRGD